MRTIKEGQIWKSKKFPSIKILVKNVNGLIIDYSLVGMDISYKATIFEVLFNCVYCGDNNDSCNIPNGVYLAQNGNAIIKDDNQATKIVGQKYDSEKPKFSLIPSKPLWQVVEVLEFGAGKYGVDNWQSVPNARERYFNACHRHLNAWWAGEKTDSESRLPHLAHAVCCLLFLMWFDKKGG